MDNNSEGDYCSGNLQVESLPPHKPDSSFANTFPEFSKTISFFMFLNFGGVTFKVRQLLLSDCFLFFYKVFTINGDVRSGRFDGNAGN